MNNSQYSQEYTIKIDGRKLDARVDLVEASYWAYRAQGLLPDAKVEIYPPATNDKAAK